MGVTISTLGLLASSLLSIALATLTAYEAKEKSWTRGTVIAFASVAISVIAILLALFIVIQSKSSPLAAAAGAFEGMAFGVILSFILMILAMTAIAFSQTIVAVEMRRQNLEKAMGFSAISIAIAFASMILSLLLIIFLF